MSFREDFQALKCIGADPAGGWSRPAFSAPDIEAHDWLIDQARTAGLSARYDGFGNAILLFEGDDRPAIVIGSHLDTVPGGGAFDGAIGVLAGLEVLRRLTEDRHDGAPVEVVAFRDEEGRFGPFTGSRAMAGLHAPEDLAKARAGDGEMLADAATHAGFAPANAPRDWSRIAAYLELHIEQGPVLEQAGIGLGIVSAIAGQERLSVRFIGRPDHAGTCPMDLRRDAFAGAARFADAFRSLIRGVEDPGLRGTIGIVKVLPNRGNVVPSEVTLGLEIRATAAALLIRMRDEAEALATRVAAAERLEFRLRRVYSEAPVPMESSLRGRLATAADRLNRPWMELPSGANHDAGVLGRIVPAAMLFVPSRDGRSHCPEEHTETSTIEAAIEVLHHAVLDLRA